MRKTLPFQALWIVLSLVVVAAAYWGGSRFLGTGLVDDSFIFLRYAKNFAHGLGPVFNPGERVEGYTSPLWLAMLSVIALTGANLARASELLSASLGLATLLLVLLTGRATGARGIAAALFAALFLATNPPYVFWTWSGMDTALFTLLFTATFFLFLDQMDDDRRMTGAGICFSLATLARPDMLALFPVYVSALVLLNRHRRALIPAKLLTFVAPLSLVVLHGLWRFAYYGSPLPNTFYAKADVPLANLIGKGLKYDGHFFFAYQMYFWIGLGVTALLYDRDRRSVRARLLGAAVTAVWFAYVAVMGGDHFPSFRFFVPLLPLLASLSAGSVSRLLSGAAEAPWKSVTAGAAALLTVPFLNLSIYQLQGRERGREELALARSWADTGLWLRRHTPERTTLAAVVVGAIPFYSQRDTIDLIGLTDAHIARHGKVYLPDPVGHQKYDTDYVLSRQPDYIVYQSSGLFDRPVHPGGALLPGEYAHAFRDLVADPRTWSAYEYQAFRMENGRYIEVLRKRGTP